MYLRLHIYIYIYIYTMTREPSRLDLVPTPFYRSTTYEVGDFIEERPLKLAANTSPNTVIQQAHEDNPIGLAGMLNKSGWFSANCSQSDAIRFTGARVQVLQIGPHGTGPHWAQSCPMGPRLIRGPSGPGLKCCTIKAIEAQ